MWLEGQAGGQGCAGVGGLFEEVSVRVGSVGSKCSRKIEHRVTWKRKTGKGVCMYVSAGGVIGRHRGQSGRFGGGCVGIAWGH